MNVENLRKVADHMDGLPALPFRQRVPVRKFDGDAVFMGAVCLRGSARHEKPLLEGECGTVGCIAGHTLCLLDPDNETEGYWADRAAKLLGLSHPDADKLFEGYPMGLHNFIDGTDCALVLRAIADGKTVSRGWDLVRERYGA